jgi:hypothetical protein
MNIKINKNPQKPTKIQINKIKQNKKTNKK